MTVISKKNEADSLESEAFDMNDQYASILTNDLYDLQGKVLISTHQLKSTAFEDTLVLICEHTSSRVMGLIINKTSDLSQNELISQIKGSAKTKNFKGMILDGGPLKKDQGFVLHRPDKKKWRHSKMIIEDIMLTTSKDIIEAIADGQYNNEYVIALGFCGWEPQQLANEIKSNDWLVAPCRSDVILVSKNSEKKGHILRDIGIYNIANLNPNIGVS